MGAARIKPYPDNPRHNDAAVDAVAASLKEFGFRQPIVVDTEGVIIVGHTRYKAAQKLGLETGAGPCGQGPDARAGQGVPHRRQRDGGHRRMGLRTAADRIGGIAGHGFRPGSAGLLARTSWRSCSIRACRTGLTDPGRCARAARRGDHAAGRPVDPGQPPPALRRQQQGRGRGPSAGWRHDPVGQHRSALQRDGRAAEQQRHRRRPRRSFHGTTHHQQLDLAAASREAKPTDRKMRAKDRPLANDFVSDEAFDQHAGRLVRQHRPRAGAGPRLLHLGRLCQLRQLPAGAQGARSCTSPRRSSG